MKTFRQLALSFPGVNEQPHFDRIAFKIQGKKIFASVLEKANSANILLSITDQKILSQYNHKLIFPVANKFGLQGWTTFDLKHLPEEIVMEALRSSYEMIVS